LCAALPSERICYARTSLTWRVLRAVNTPSCSACVGAGLCREGTKDHALEAGVTLDDVQRVAALGHGTLAEDLAGDDERSAEFLPHGLRLREHEYLAVDTGVHVLAVAVFRAPDEVDVLLLS
jgi:hypothetical protein